MKPTFTLSGTMAQHLKPSPTLYINERVQEMWEHGRKVYHMGFGESRFPVHPKLQAALQENAHQQSYLAGQGLRPLRENVARFYSGQVGHEVTAAQVMIGPGSKSLIYAAQMALDAELILPTPSWVSYEPQARLLKRPVRRMPATAADGYQWTVADLDQVVQTSSHPQKALLLNSPNNPTGQMFTADFLEELTDYCRAKGIIILSDEIYGLVPHGLRPHISPAQFYPEGTVVFGGLSKHLSLGGWRLGTAVVPDATLLKAMLVVAGEIWSSPTGPVQYAAVVAYSGDEELEQYVRESSAIHAARTQHVWSWFNELGITCVQPAGAFYMFPNFDRWREPLAARGVITSEKLAAYLLDEYQVVTLPGTAFGVRPEELSLRVATSYLDMETDEQAEKLLQAYRVHGDTERLIVERHPMMGEALQQVEAFVGSLRE